MRLAIEGGIPIRSEPWPKFHTVDQDDEELLLKTLRSETWSNGSMTRIFEEQFAQFCQVQYCLLVENATAALKLILHAAGIGPGDEVIIPGMTWPSVPVAVLECGAMPIPVDVNLETLAISVNAFKLAITPRTKAVIPTHLFSSQADMPSITRLAAQGNILVIEDCAHSVGARRLGKVLGTFGDAAIFSFNQKKLLACGEGGCLITNNIQLFEHARELQQFSITSSSMPFLPGTHLASEFQAALLIGQLKKLPAKLSMIEERAELLRSLLGEVPNILPLERLPYTECQTFYNFCFRIENAPDISWFRNALGAELNLSIAGGYQPFSDINAISNPIDPRFQHVRERSFANLPNSRLAHYQQAVRFRYNAFMADENAIYDIFRAITKVLFRKDFC